MRTALWVTAGFIVAAGTFTVLASPSRLAWYWNRESNLVLRHYWRQKAQWR